MKRLSLILAAASVCVLLSQSLRVFAADTPPMVVVQGPTVVAFFPPVTKAELEKDPDTNETLADFQTYQGRRVRERFKKAGIELHELYTHSFQLRVGKTVTTFHSTKEQIGYYFVAPGKKPRIEYGVLTQVDLLDIAHEYFGTPAE